MNQPVTSGQEFVISRVFDAPRDLVFRSFTEEERLRHWWGPKGFTVVRSAMEFGPGGYYHYCLKGPSGALMWGKMAYREIAAPERLIWINSFSDEERNITRHPMAPDWPRELMTTVLFEEDGKGRTKVTVKWSPHHANEIERATFEQGHASMNQGWSGTFEQLAAYLAKFVA